MKKSWRAGRGVKKLAQSGWRLILRASFRMTAYQAAQNSLRSAPQFWLVTGAAGFIGSHVVEQLLRLGQRVRVLDNFFSGHAVNLEAVRQIVGHEAASRLEFVEGDIRDTDVCGRACESASRVVHLAALGSVPLSLEQPMLCHEINVTGTLNLMLAAHAAGIKRVVYASSSAVYGDDELPAKREESIGRPLSPYAASKHINEIHASMMRACHGLETVGMRFFNVFGPRQDPRGAYAAVIPCWLAALRQGEDVFINGDGENTRDFCFVRDVVQALILAATTSNNAAFGEAFNVGLGAATSLNQLHATISAIVAEATGRPVPAAIYRDFRPGDIRHSCADTSRVRQVLGFAPEFTLMDGLRETAR